jgi:hypothetical protein
MSKLSNRHPQAPPEVVKVNRRLAVVAAVALAAAAPAPGGAAPVVAAQSRYGLIKNFQQIGATTLGNRGVNSPVAVAGKCVYVGDRYDKNGIAIVDVSNPRKPRQVGTIAPERGSTQREIRADKSLGMLVVMMYSLGGIGSTTGNYLKVYDIRNCTRPTLLSTYDFGPRSPHEFFLWKDPKKPGRALAYVTMAIYTPDLEVIDLTNKSSPALLTVYDTTADNARPLNAFNSDGGYLHSISVSDDGKKAYLGTWDFGMYVADTSLLADASPAPVIRPAGAPVFYTGNVHGAVKVPGKPYAVLVEEGYAGVYTDVVEESGCPFGWLRMADLTNEAAPTLTGAEYKLPENDCTRSRQLNGTFTSHNQTVFPNVALLAYYGGGLRAVDISNPKSVSEAGAFVPKPTFEPDMRDSRLYFKNSERWTGAMWSYPVVQDGLIYVVDIDLGLFILRYTGPHAKEVSQAVFVEGNSAPSRYTRNAAVGIVSTDDVLTGPPVTVRSPFADVPQDAARLARFRQRPGFFCTLL